MNSWLDIIDALYEGSWNRELQRFRSPCAFRGHGRAGCGLSSRLVRLAGGRADIRRLEQALLRNFRKYGHAEAGRADSIWHWLALGQHRGLPTRLLDWTYSPLVALHFATAEAADFDTDGVVWCVNFIEANKRLPDRLRRMLDEEASDTFTVHMLETIGDLRAFEALSPDAFVVFLEPPALDERIRHQLALFSLISEPAASLDDWLTRHPELCRRVAVPAALKREIRDKLDQANVNERVLFPGLDGLSRWLTRYYTPAVAPALQPSSSTQETQAMAQTKADDDDDLNREADPNREFIPEQTSTKNVSDAPREFAKEFRDEMEFAANVDPAEEDLEKQRQSPQHAAGITNRPLEEEEHEQEKLPQRNDRKAAGGR